MPTYEYECERCTRVFEVWQRISDAPLTVCDRCAGTVRRLLAPPTFILKGSGFYVNDYPSEARKKAMEAEKKSESGSPPASSTPASAPSSSGS